MRQLKTWALVVAAATVLVLAANTTAIAATGKGFILGKKNTASRTTEIKRTTYGPALSILTRSRASAPFQVNGSGRVARLNADMVDGLHATQLRTTVQTFEIALGSQPISSLSKQIPLASGRYLMSYTGTFDDVTGYTYCWFEQVINPGNPFSSELIVGEDIYEGTNLAALNGHGVLTVTAAKPVSLVCQSDGVLGVQENQPVQVTAQRIDLGTHQVLTAD